MSNVKCMKILFLMSIYLIITGAFLGYLFFGKIKGKPLVSSKALWIFYLIEKIFGENDSSKERVKENGMSRHNPDQNKDA